MIPYFFKKDLGGGHIQSLNLLVYYTNMPMHYVAIFKGCKNDNFQIKKRDFLIFAQNIDCGYLLEPPSRCTHDLYLRAKIRK